jgi:hypothetical protein
MLITTYITTNWYTMLITTYITTNWYTMLITTYITTNWYTMLITTYITTNWYTMLKQNVTNFMKLPTSFGVTLHRHLKINKNTQTYLKYIKIHELVHIYVFLSALCVSPEDGVILYRNVLPVLYSLLHGTSILCTRWR